MTSLNNLTGKWKGTYKYGPEYADMEGTSVDFILEITDTDGEINGTSVDNETKDLFDKPTIVQGFWDGEIISFTKQYPYAYYLDEQNKIQVDKNMAPHTVTYSGQIDAETNSFTGEWDIIIDSQKIGDGYFDESLTGTWTLVRETQA